MGSDLEVELMPNHVLDDINQLVQRLWKISTKTEKDRYIENLTQKVCAKIWNRDSLPEQPYYARENLLRGWQEAMFEIRRQEQRAERWIHYLSPTDFEKTLRTSLRSMLPKISSVTNWGDKGDYYYEWFKIPDQGMYADISYSRTESVLYWDLYLSKSAVSDLGDRYLSAGYERDRNTLYKKINIEGDFLDLASSVQESKLAKIIQKLIKENTRLLVAAR